MSTRGNYYTIKQMDGRFSYREWFSIYISFSGTMFRQQGPWYFAQAQKWFVRTYGWSAEIKQYAEMHRWLGVQGQMTHFPNYRPLALDAGIEEVCNPHWSWSNQYNDLRIYLQGDKELAFWELGQPLNQLKSK